ncbi:MAG: undecaprenyl-diphosphate phosphatase [Calditrichaeota bacterium]|nr:undecaprenyl-diphosphate phosphatase [Candidatus Cloacimonadota bacterium]MCB1046749.1 undecaprenyl-diphosphate phosphatase [Calditrichota bacterium]MCB9474654.1 undecaprenyl-diphosphate phosphatase [Candidatus Delongbacteria bacterium]
MLETIILGLVQGLTEFLPISSSGHLVLGQELLGIEGGTDIRLEIILHLGTLLAIVFAYRQDVLRLALALVPGRGDPEYRRLLGLLVAASIPTALIGLSLKDFFESVFAHPATVSALLMVTGLILLIGDRARRGEVHAEDIGWKRAVTLGLAQSMAILPGISRSGSTIVTGLLLRIQPEEAARFSFLMSVPAVAGAALLQLKDSLEPNALPPAYSTIELLAGFASAAIVGYFALQWLLVAVRKRSLSWFAVYCLLVGATSLVLRAL